METSQPGKLTIGNLEICGLPEIGIRNLQVRVDTGAKTSSIHVDNLKSYKQDGKPWVSFDIHPDIYDVEQTIHCTSRIHDVRKIKSSNGESEKRYVIKTQLQLGSHCWPIELTLSDRSDMSYMMLLGREGMGDKVLVDPSQTFLLNDDD